MNEDSSIQDDKCEDCIRNLNVNQRRDLVVSELKRKSKIRAIFKDCPVSELSSILERMQAVFEERIQEDEEKAAREAVLMEKAQSVFQVMAEKGIDIETLREIQKQQDTTSAIHPKVKYIKDGVPWSGQGRRPAPFKGLSDFDLEKYRKVPQKIDEK
ncbi:hypothetical protein [Marinobacterium aestuariivivens]|uniref:DNA-binding protein H-NS-like N-terminal domain-containing protein n=1 Tax=Marinobacterium aestuariivivens TaxID=1698799 RepID=A0ABW2AA96_9GAMM